MAVRGDILGNAKIAILASDGFDEASLLVPKGLLEAAGAHVVVVAPRPGRITSWHGGDWGGDLGVGLTLELLRPADFHALLLPGGVLSADELRGITKAVELVAVFAASGKPVAALDHAVWLPLEARLGRNRRMTSVPHLKTEIRDAGATWADQDVVEDGALLTGHHPDLDHFTRKLIQKIQQGSLVPHVPVFTHDADKSVH